MGPFMREQPRIATSPTETLTVLSISPLEGDHLFLKSIVGHSTWRLFNADRVRPALDFLQRHEISVVLCERDLMPGTWIDVLEHTNTLPHPPSLIVTSRLADERLWSEALNFGAWDVLAKPFDRKEVFRCVKSGWQHWYDQIHTPGTAVTLMTVAG
jgi:DNA-binding NtrC family response regulator